MPPTFLCRALLSMLDALRVAFAFAKSPMSVLLGQRLKATLKIDCAIPQVTFVGGAYTASTHLDSFHLPCLFLLEAHWGVRSDRWRKLIVNAVVSTGPA